MRKIKFAIYFSLLLGTLVIGWPRFQVLAILLTSQSAYFRHIPSWFIWLPLGLALLAYTVVFTLSALMRFRLGQIHHLAVIMLFSAALIARILDAYTPVETDSWRDLQEAPPHWLLAKAVGELHRELQVRGDAQATPIYPSQRDKLMALMAPAGQMPPCGFRGHGFPLPIHFVVVADASGPVLAPRPGDRPGTIYYAVSMDASRYWLTAVGQDNYPTGEPRVMIDTQGRAIVVGPGLEPAEEGP